MTTATQFLGQFLGSFKIIKIMDIVDILVVALLIYKIMQIVRTTRASRIAKGIVLLLLITWLTGLVRMHMISFILNKILEIGMIALVIMFQPELRRFLERVGSKSLKELLVSGAQVRSIDQTINATVAACEIMSKEKIGVLIVFERKMLLDEYFKTGTVLDAAVSEQLLRNIFFPKAALHDGATIIRGNRVQAAGCVLPLSENSHLSSDLGTRHRAGIGMSELSDAVVVIVSEETGTISVAVGGMLKRHLAPKTLERILTTELSADAESAKPAKVIDRLKYNLTKKDGKHEK